MTTEWQHDELKPDPDCHVAFVQLWNYKAAADVRLTCGHRLHVFYGDNGMGKTTILDAIAAGLVDVSECAKQQRGKVEDLVLRRENIRRSGDRTATEAAVVLRLGAGTNVVHTELHRAKNVLSTPPFEPPEFQEADAKAWFQAAWAAVKNDTEAILPLFVYYLARANARNPK